MRCISPTPSLARAASSSLPERSNFFVRRLKCDRQSGGESAPDLASKTGRLGRYPSALSLSPLGPCCWGQGTLLTLHEPRLSTCGARSPSQKPRFEYCTNQGTEHDGSAVPDGGDI